MHSKIILIPYVCHRFMQEKFKILLYIMFVGSFNSLSNLISHNIFYQNLTIFHLVSKPFMFYFLFFLSWVPEITVDFFLFVWMSEDLARELVEMFVSELSLKVRNTCILKFYEPFGCCCFFFWWCYSADHSPVAIGNLHSDSGSWWLSFSHLDVKVKDRVRR